MEVRKKITLSYGNKVQVNFLENKGNKKKKMLSEN